MAERPLVALTGATGFIGGALLAAPDAAAWRWRALTRRDVGERHDVEWVRGDMADEAALTTLVAGAEVVIHAAGLVKARRVAEFERVNAESVARIARISRQAGVRKFILISSLAARIPDISPYAASKRHGEELLAAEAGEMPWMVLRPPAVYGPGDREFATLFKPLTRGFAPLPPGEEPHYSIIHVDDLTAAMLQLITVDVGSGQTIYVDDGAVTGYTLADIYRLAASALDASPRFIRIPRSVLTGVAALSSVIARLHGVAPIFSPGKVREICFPDWVVGRPRLDELCAWRPKISAAEGIPQSLSWYRAQGLL